MTDVEEDDPDLRAAIEASLREANAPRPSAPAETPIAERAQPTYGYAAEHARPELVPPPPMQVPSYDLAPLESDAIMTFTQMVEQVQVRGGKDMSRYPAVNELYERASGLRPKLALSLDDAGRKERTWIRCVCGRG